MTASVLEPGATAEAYRVEIVGAPARTVAVHRFRAAQSEVGRKIGDAFRKVMRFGAAHGLALGGPAIAHYTMRPDGFEVAAGFVVHAPFEGDDEVGLLELPAVEVATTTHVGSYDGLPRAYDAVRVEVEARGRVLDDAYMWEEYLDGPETPLERHRTVVMWPVVAHR